MLRKYVIYNTRDVTFVEESYGLGYQAGLHSDRFQHNPYDDPERNLAWQKGYREGQNRSKMRSNYRRGEIRNKSFQQPAQRDVSKFKEAEHPRNAEGEFLYHATPSQNLPNIKKMGLEGKTYLARSANAAIRRASYFRDLTPKERKDLRVLKILRKDLDPKLLKADKHVYDPGYQGKIHSFEYNGPIKTTRVHDTQDFKSERGWIAKVYSSTGSVVAQSPAFLSEKLANKWLQERTEKAIKMGYRVTGKVQPGFFDPWQVAQSA